MRLTPKLSGLLVMILCLCVALPANAQKKGKKKKKKGDETAAPAPSKDKNPSEITKSCVAYEGLFNIYQDSITGKSYM